MSASLDEYRQRLREALKQIQLMETELEEMAAERTEPIAIVGAACRFPGGANSPEQFYQILLGGNDAIGEVPNGRWRRSNHEEQAARWGAFLHDIDAFDAQFFGISPREAILLDPQQRILLETSWEALERAGQRPNRNAASSTGVFMGISTSDYMLLGTQRDPNEFELYDITGNGHCFPAGRLSYVFGFQGPCFAVDTACSSSLVATHLACQSLRLRECDMALAGGTQLMISPVATAMLTRSRALSPDGKCKAFDARANGFVRGEGVGVIVLKRLSDAQRDGDSISALIIGSSVNQDGTSAGFTAPNGKAQEQLLRMALANARVTPDAIDFIETHGTGTSLGDPIEAEALLTVFGVPRTDDSKCMLGAVKTNVGHLEAAAGIAGIIKTLGIFGNSIIPRNLHFRALNPRFTFDGTALAIPTENRPWERSAKPRRAGVSAFGMSGTNAHVILEEPPVETDPAPATPASAYLLPLSAKTPNALSALTRLYTEWFSNEHAPALHDVAYTASVRRVHHEHRMAIVASTREEFERTLATVTADAAAAGLIRSAKPTEQVPKIVFVFPGQGSQWIGMCRQLLREEPAFRTSIDKCDDAIRGEAGFSILEQIHADEPQSRIGDIDIVQPLLFSIGVALAALWRSWGIEPDCVVGHSMGEVAAAHVAGMLTLHDAVKVICRRSRLLKRIKGQGAMALVELPTAEAQRAIEAHKSTLSIAASNGPRSTVLSGDSDALERVLATLEQRGIFCRRIKVDAASHSPQVDSLRQELIAMLQDIRPAMGKVAMRSTVTLAPLNGPELVAGYWADNLRDPVLFSQATQTLVREDYHLLIELSPHPILLPSIQENLKELQIEGVAIASMRRQTDEQKTMLEALGHLYVQGCVIDWEKLYPDRGRVVPLPSYPWQRDRFWLPSIQKKTVWQPADGHPLLGTRIVTSTQPNTWFWKLDLSIEDIPYLADHKIGDQILLPGAGYIEVALAAARELLGEQSFVIEDLTFLAPLLLEKEKNIPVEIAISSTMNGTWSFHYSSLASSDESSRFSAPLWTLHAQATIRVLDSNSEAFEHSTLSQAREHCSQDVALDDILRTETMLGFNLGPAFRGLQEIRRGANEALGRIELPDNIGARADSYLVHPALLDGALRVGALVLPKTSSSGPPLLARIGRLTLQRRAGRAAWSHARSAADRAHPHPSVTLFDDTGDVLIAIDGIEVHIPPELWGNEIQRDDLFIRQNWKLEESTSAERARGRWLLLCDEFGVAVQVNKGLVERGHEVLCVWPRSKNSPSKLRKEIDPESPDELRSLLSETLKGRVPLAGIIHCWGLSSGVQQTTSSAELDLSSQKGFTSAWQLVQTLSRMALRDMPRLWLVTRGTQMVLDDPKPIEMAQVALWGLGRMIALKYPELKCARIDIDSGEEPSMEGLVREIVARDNKEEEIALRRSNRYVGRLERIAPHGKPKRTPVVHANASYLITGGLSDIGLLGANWLVRAGARHIVLMDDERLKSAHSEAIAEIESMGASVVVESANVADREQLRRVLQKIDAGQQPLKGVLHCAYNGEIVDFGELHADRLQKSLAPRILGGWNLHVETQHRAIDWLVFFSSLHGLMGSPALGSEVIGSGFLDALAHHRRYHDLPAISIDWGPIGGLGLSQALVGEARLAQHGMDELSSDDGGALFIRALRERWVQMGIASMDIRRWLESHPQATPSPRFRPLTIRDAGVTARAHDGRKTDLLDKLQTASPTAREEILDEFLREQLGAILRMDPSRIDRLAPIRGLGLDSLMSLEFRNRLESALRIRLSATLVWSHPTIAAINKYVGEQLPAATASKTEEPSIEAAVAAPVAASSAETVIAVESSAEDVELFKSFDLSLGRMRSRRKS